MTNTTPRPAQDKVCGYVLPAPCKAHDKAYEYRTEYIEPLIRNYVYLNVGLAILLNGQRFLSRHGLVDLLNEYMTSENLYEPIHLKGQDIEVVITHSNQYGEEYGQRNREGNCFVICKQCVESCHRDERAFVG